MPFDDPDVASLKAALCCIYMPCGKSWLCDTEHFHPFPQGRSAVCMIKMETRIYCHCMARFLNIDLQMLFMGGDTLAIRTLMDSGSGWDNAGELMRFLCD